MGKIVLSFILGVLVASFAFLRFDFVFESGDWPNIDRSNAPVAEDSEFELVDSAPDSQSRLTASQSVDSSGSNEATTAREQQVLRELEAARAAITQLDAELGAIRTARRRAQVPIVSSLVLPAEFDWLSETNYFQEYDEIQREHVDPEWAAATEAQINAYLSRHPTVTDEYGLPVTVHCRSMRCAVAFVSYRDDEDLNTISRQFHDSVSDYANQPWADQFIPRGRLFLESKDGVTSIYWSLMKKGSE